MSILRPRFLNRGHRRGMLAFCLLLGRFAASPRPSSLPQWLQRLSDSFLLWRVAVFRHLLPALLDNRPFDNYLQPFILRFFGVRAYIFLRDSVWFGLQEVLFARWAPLRIDYLDLESDFAAAFGENRIISGGEESAGSSASLPSKPGAALPLSFGGATSHNPFLRSTWTDVVRSSWWNLLDAATLGFVKMFANFVRKNTCQTELFDRAVLVARLQQPGETLKAAPTLQTFYRASDVPQRSDDVSSPSGAGGASYTRKPKKVRLLILLSPVEQSSSPVRVQCILSSKTFTQNLLGGRWGKSCCCPPAGPGETGTGCARLPSSRRRTAARTAHSFLVL